MTAIQQALAERGLRNEICMFARAYHLVDDGTMDTIIGCNGCMWEGRYNPDSGYLEDGYADGGTPYTHSELNLMRVTAAMEMAAEDHYHGEGGQS